MKVQGFELRDALTGKTIQRFTEIPPRVDLPTGDVVFAAVLDWSNGDFQIIATTWVEPDPVPERRMVRKSLIIERLNTAGKLSAASSALNADLYRRERWYASDHSAIYADDAEALALLNAIGADPLVIMAVE